MSLPQTIHHFPPPRPAARSSTLNPLNVLTPINVLAARLGVTSRALRHYEAIGLVEAQRGTRSVRWYDRETVEILETVTLLRSVEVPIAEIRRVMARRSDPQAYADTLRDVLAETLTERRRCVATIEDLMANVETVFAPQHPDPSDPS